MIKQQTEPAVRKYFFKNAYTDVFDLIMNASSKNRYSYLVYTGIVSDIKRKRMGLIGLILSVILSVVFSTAIISGFVLWAALAVVIPAVYLPIALVITIITFVFMKAVYAADKLYRVGNHIFSVCPRCKERADMPVYLCPSCGTAHTNLMPSIYGIFKRNCLCGYSIPCSSFSGRSKLKSRCPVCAAQVSSREAVPLCISVIGGRAVGKTSYITAVIRELVKEALPKAGLSLSYYDRQSKENTIQLISGFAEGRLLSKTELFNIPAYSFFIKGEKLTPERSLHLYDIAGDAFAAEEDALAVQKQYGFCHGFIFIIDPLAIPEVKDTHIGKADLETFSPSNDNINDTFSAFYNNLKRISGLGASAVSKIPCAVVINKCDAYGIEEEIGMNAAYSLMNANLKSYQSVYDAMDSLVRDFLLRNGMSNFISNIELCFKHHRFFSCSALGHSFNNSSFRPARVYAPLEWIISISDKKLRKFTSAKDKNIK